MAADVADVEAIIKSVGLFLNKARNIIKTARIVHEELADVVPTDQRHHGVTRCAANCNGY